MRSGFASTDLALDASVTGVGWAGERGRKLRLCWEASPLLGTERSNTKEGDEDDKYDMWVMAISKRY
jgi:hypothetical protein